MSEVVAVDSYRPLAAVLVSLIAVVLVMASARRPRLSAAWVISAAIVQFVLVASMAPGVASKTTYRTHLGTIALGLLSGWIEGLLRGAIEGLV